MAVGGRTATITEKKNEKKRACEGSKGGHKKNGLIGRLVQNQCGKNGVYQKKERPVSKKKGNQKRRVQRGGTDRKKRIHERERKVLGTTNLWAKVGERKRGNLQGDRGERKRSQRQMTGRAEKYLGWGK